MSRQKRSNYTIPADIDDDFDIPDPPVNIRTKKKISGDSIKQMSKKAERVPYQQWIANMTEEEFKNWEAKRKGKGKGKGKKAGTKTTYRGKGGFASKRVQAGPFATFYGYGEYNNRDPYAKIDPRTDYAFEPDYGSRLGSVVGEGLQSFAHALGFGEYNIQSNSMLSSKFIDTGTSPPRVMNTNRGEATVFNHREYLGDLLTGTGTPSAFTLQQYSLNIGNSTLFPFGSRLAQNFQEWEVRGMLVELKSLASNTSTTLNMGSMFIACDYNSLDPAPSSKIELENLEYACSNKPSDSIIMPVECARKNDVLTHLYVAIDEDYQGGDKRLYDLGRLFIGSFGCPSASAPIAEIWITYEIALFKPHLHPLTTCPAPLAIEAAHFIGEASTNADPLGTPSGPASGMSVTSNTLYIPMNAGSTDKIYILDHWWRTQGTISAPKPPGVILTSSGSTASLVTDTWSGISANHMQTYAYTPSSTLINADSFSLNYCVKVPPGEDAQVTLDGTGSLIASGKVSYWDLWVSRFA